MKHEVAMRLLIATPLPTAVETEARDTLGAIPATENLTPEAMIALAAREKPEAILLSGRQKLGAEGIAQLPDSVRLIATCSVGYDHIDVKAATARGIAVTNTPDVLTAATADMTMLLMLGAARRAREYAAIMDEGWRRSFALNEMLGTDLSGKLLGIVGMGRIGRAVAHRARAFGMTIAYHNRHRLPPEQEAGAEFVADTDALVARADVLSLNLPGSGEVVMTAERFALMKPGAVFVNSARGSLVDEDALVDALASGRLAGAGLDVFRNEPAYDLRLRDQPRAFLMPHMGSATIETREAMGRRALANVAAFLKGGKPADQVNA
ncbi:D-glycerate dehydrogenase [Sinirhodobacter populi]|uniref:D-glycerate dehydrogenase n=2 Tax=Paenirhodobacter populi TaxID=2306993 RepID=A0A443KJU1_9RHOB|nr:D-glycerate dehydrogenase [Sinirhodobacter populi]